MRIERQTGKHRRWSVEIDPSIERAVAAVAVVSVGGAAYLLGALKAIFG